MIKLLQRTSLLLALLLIQDQTNAQILLDTVINPSHFKIHHIGPDDGPCRTGGQAAGAPPAMIALGRIGREVQRNENLAEKEP